MRKYVTQMLDDIQQDPKAIEIYKGDAVLKLIFEYARPHLELAKSQSNF